MSFPHNKPQTPPVFSGDPPRNSVRSDPDFYGDFALPWDPVQVKVHVRLLRMGSPFPPVLWSSCTQAPLAFNARCSEALSPCARSLHVRVWCVAQNSHSCRWVSVNQLVSSLWSFPPRRYGVVYMVKSPLLLLDLASSFSSGVRVSFLIFLVHFDEECSIFSC